MVHVQSPLQLCQVFPMAKGQYWVPCYSLIKFDTITETPLSLGSFMDIIRC